ncbi:MAG TPA: hypothetical protein VJ727_04690 [Rhodanobacteraceae bacterium]|nr:hypothetical protein [Rhodanobacteraceae bacterium]
MEALKQLLIAAFAPAARRGALIELQRHVPREKSRASARNGRRGRRARVFGRRRLAFAL